MACYFSKKQKKKETQINFIFTGVMLYCWQSQAECQALPRRGIAPAGVDLYRGVTFSQSFNNDVGWFGGDVFGGVSLGNFVNIKRRFADPGRDLSMNQLLQHEYGHTFDSHLFGPAYLFAIGIPSAAGAGWTETRAELERLVF